VVLSQDEIIQIITLVVDWHFPVIQVSSMYHITSERVYQLVHAYRKTGLYPAPKRLGRPPNVPSPAMRNLILSEKKRLGIGSRALHKYFLFNLGITIGERMIHRVLLEENMTEPEPKKGFRRPAWIRYEREESLSAVHMDWHESKYNGKQVCVVLDDASRMILAGGEFPRATTEFYIQLLQEAYETYEYITPIGEVITDHGTQFYANTRDFQGNAEHAFERFCKQKEITHILARVKHPQTNGKVERWFGTYKQFRGEFATFEEFVIWYNTVRPHRSLDDVSGRLRTPKEVFWKRAEGHIMRNCNYLFNKQLAEEST
jgi:putative transposase